MPPKKLGGIIFFTQDDICEPMPNSKTLTLRAGKPVFGGDCLSQDGEGKKIFISGAIPGELTEIQIVETKKNYDKAKTIQVLDPSPGIGPSPCPYFRRCGGCQWLGVPYEKQLAWKTEMAQEMVQRQLPVPEIRVIPAEMTLGYRHRIQLRGEIEKGGQVILGFFEAQTHKKIPIESCAIAEEPLNGLIQFLIQKPLISGRVGERFRLELQILPMGNQILALCHPVIERGQASHLASLLERIKSYPTVLWAGYSGDPLPLVPFEERDGLVFFTSPGAFQQIHRAQNKKLQDLVAGWVQGMGDPKVIWDLYGGSGNLSLNLAKEGRKIVGVEGARLSAEIGQANLRQNSLPGEILWVHRGVEAFLKDSKKKPDLVIADPARDGMKEAIPLLLEKAPRWIIAVSCDLATGIRDLKKLVENGYRIESFVMLDFFPQTYHIETAVLLTISQG
jgi:23S rRNA (uracil1939-C5)-methyltransferase